VGTLYDLDSVVGKPVGDTKTGDFALDTKVTIGAIAELLNPVHQNYLSVEFPQLADKSQSALISAYIKERSTKQTNREDLTFIKENYFPDMENKFGEKIPISIRVWERVYKNLGL
jgi:hypothetical protein